jgi:hypothetical protein
MGEENERSGAQERRICGNAKPVRKIIKSSNMKKTCVLCKMCVLNTFTSMLSRHDAAAQGQIYYNRVPSDIGTILYNNVYNNALPNAKCMLVRSLSSILQSDY